MRCWYLGLLLGMVACTGEKIETGTDADGDGFYSPDDCDDSNANINPDAEDVCDGLDNNCDATVDEDAPLWYGDLDQDGYGDLAGTPIAACDAPTGLIADNSDCNDGDAGIHPGATEICDGVDQNCDGTVDEGATGTATFYLDADEDGHGDPSQVSNSCPPPDGYVALGDDCNDSDNTIYPAAPEDCDPIDRDCDGIPDDNAVDGTLYYPDVDGDNFGDAAANIRYCSRPAGFLDDHSDCDDGDASVNPNGQEVCDEANRDEDCDGLTEDRDPSLDKSSWDTFYQDADGDGWGDVAVPTQGCDAPAGFTNQITDCDDGNASIHPGQPEVDNGIDEDCDESVDEDFVSAGSVILTELDRQTRFGGTASVADGAWMEVYNTSSRDIDISGWYFVRTNTAVGTDAFYIDPADGLVIGAGSYLVLCKTDHYENATVSASTLACDYVWGDDTQPSSYSSRYHDNTWNPQRDEDEIQIWYGGDNSSGTLMDSVHYYYDATNGYWPRDATFTMSLDPGAYSDSDNNVSTNWCSVPKDAANLWYSDGAIAEYGTPGNPNPQCN